MDIKEKINLTKQIVGIAVFLAFGIYKIIGGDIDYVMFAIPAIVMGINVGEVRNFGKKLSEIKDIVKK